MSNFDDILDHIGEFGVHQKVLVGLLYLPILFVGMQALSYVFISAVPKHRCYVSTCDNSRTSYYEEFLNWTTSWDSTDRVFSSCSVYGRANSKNDTVLLLHFASLGNNSDPNLTTCRESNFDRNTTNRCDSWIFDNSTYRRTVVTDWNLVCDDFYFVAMSQSAYMLGTMIGSVVFGLASDKYGRKNSMMSAVVIAAVFSGVTPIVPYYSMFLVMKVIIGAAFQGIYMTVFVMSLELVGKSKRALCGIFVIIYFSFGEILLGVLAFYIRDWKVLQLVVSLPMVLFLSYIWIIPESPRWLISRKQFAKADAILEKIARSNNRTMPVEIIKSMGNVKVDEDGNKSDDPFETMKMLYFSPILRWRTLNVAFNWMMITMAYYGITLSTPNLGGSEFWSFIEVSAVELPAYFYCMFVMDRYGRRLPLCACMIVGGAASFCTYFVPTSPQYFWLSITLALVAKFGAAAAYAIIYVFTAELFPTIVRNNVIGFCAMLGHIGGVMAPYVASMSSYNDVLPMMIYGVCSLLAGLAALTVPETLNQKLPDTIQEAADFGR